MSICKQSSIKNDIFYNFNIFTENVWWAGGNR